MIDLFALTGLSISWAADSCLGFLRGRANFPFKKSVILVTVIPPHGVSGSMVCAWNRQCHTLHHTENVLSRPAYFGYDLPSKST